MGQKLEKLRKKVIMEVSGLKRKAKEPCIGVSLKKLALGQGGEKADQDLTEKIKGNTV